jgi:hypothetical protein
MSQERLPPLSHLQLNSADLSYISFQADQRIIISFLRNPCIIILAFSVPPGERLRPPAEHALKIVPQPRLFPIRRETLSIINWCPSRRSKSFVSETLGVAHSLPLQILAVGGHTNYGTSGLNCPRAGASYATLVIGRTSRTGGFFSYVGIRVSVWSC